ncbi:MAG: tRNA-binding protein [Gammaproteobacteria bacterium]|nr:tRNA-binding protein [Gammaproteobacteria bacterium]
MSAEQIEFDDFQKVDMRTGTVVDVKPNPKARKPAFVLTIDFGDALGQRTSSAQLTENYDVQSLIGKQIVAVVNFPPMRIAGVKSEVLVLGAMTDQHGVVLLEPTFGVPNGTAIG